MGVIDNGAADHIAGLRDYVNVPPTIGLLLSADPMLIGPLSTTIGLEGMHDLIEINQIDAYNLRVIRAAQEREEERGR